MLLEVNIKCNKQYLNNYNIYLLCSSRKYPCPSQGRLKEIPRGRGVSKTLFCKGKYDTKMEFPKGWGAQTEKLSVGGVWIFSGTTHSNVP